VVRERELTDGLMERKVTNKRDAANEEGNCPKLMRSTLAAASAAGHTLFEWKILTQHLPNNWYFFFLNKPNNY
jgi:predicted carbohydrate-binding protein with CBM5 and CBM33 domain